jgi:signal transduction histidine kinase
MDECDVDELIENVSKMMQGQIIASNATIVKDLATPTITFPKVYLESVIYNMVSNSLKYKQDHIAPVIEISTRKSAGKTLLCFKDNGLGIDLEKYGQNMFKLNKTFHRGFDSKGVGLFMTKAQVEAFGGNISVLSEVNKGTEFIVTLTSF